MLNHAARQSGTRTYALDHGVDEETLVRYANGVISDGERVTVEGVIGRCSWAREFVIDRVKRRKRQRKRSAA